MAGIYPFGYSDAIYETTGDYNLAEPLKVPHVLFERLRSRRSHAPFRSRREPRSAGPDLLSFSSQSIPVRPLKERFSHSDRLLALIKTPDIAGPPDSSFEAHSGSSFTSPWSWSDVRSAGLSQC